MGGREKKKANGELGGLGCFPSKARPMQWRWGGGGERTGGGTK